ncbi:MAG: tetratricopeptide repeat protein, partial [Chloroflexota bacterium]|nr:tetratricopeptide repeat protein [Chloroflexota bacterium]
DALLSRRDDLVPVDVARALYWRGKALTRLGRADEARGAWQQAAASRPGGYYSLIAAARLGSLPTTRSAEAETEELTAWMSARHLDPAAATAAVAADAGLARAQQLASLGLLRQGNWEADELLQRYADRPDRLYILASRFGELGLAGASTRLGQAALAAASLESPLDAPPGLRRLAYPRPFFELTQSRAERYGLDPLLLEATLREASRFDAWTEDAARGARGLASMSPIHAEEAGRALGSGDADVSRPVVAVEEQAWMLADRLRRFGGRPEAVLSALATTERVVDAWLVRPGAEDAEVFIEQIDYEAARTAVRDALAARIVYATTYAASRPVDPLALVRVKPEPTAAWVKIARLGSGLALAAPLAPLAAPGTADERQTFDRAAALQRDGEHTAASDLLRPLLGASDPAVLSAARLRLGQALLAAGRAGEAFEALATLDAAEPGGPGAFLLGRALASLGKCEQALPVLDRYVNLARGAMLAHGLVARAGCLQDLGRAGDALAALEQAVAIADLPRLHTIDLRERLAQARVRAGDLDGAAAEYAALLAAARSDSYRAELNYALGVIAPDAATAASRFRAAVQSDARTRAAQAALDELVALGDPFVASFEAGETRFEQDRYREALAAFTAFAASGGSDGRVARAHYGRGVSLVRLNQDRAGIAVLESMAEAFPDTPEAADGLFRAGRIRESLADLDGAAQAYGRVSNWRSAGTRATDAQFRLAFVQFRQGRLGDAASSWRDLAGRVSSADDRAQALFWLGKALRAQGDPGAAASALAAARDTDPRGFYGVRAAELL